MTQPDGAPVRLPAIDLRLVIQAGTILIALAGAYYGITQKIAVIEERATIERGVTEKTSDDLGRTVRDLALTVTNLALTQVQQTSKLEEVFRQLDNYDDRLKRQEQQPRSPSR